MTLPSTPVMCEGPSTWPHTRSDLFTSLIVRFATGMSPGSGVFMCTRHSWSCTNDAERASDPGFGRIGTYNPLFDVTVIMLLSLPSGWRVRVIPASDGLEVGLGAPNMGCLVVRPVCFPEWLCLCVLASCPFIVFSFDLKENLGLGARAALRSSSFSCSCLTPCETYVLVTRQSAHGGLPTSE